MLGELKRRTLLALPGSPVNHVPERNGKHVNNRDPHLQTTIAPVGVHD
jgi:hypothetical protein